MDAYSLPEESKREQNAAKRQRQRERTRNTFVTAGLILIFIAVILFSLGNHPNQSVSPFQIGAPLGEFSLNDINGKTIHLSDYKGQLVLINAWATWCPPCRAEMPLLDAYYQAHREQGLVILAVNSGDSQEQTAAFARASSLSFPVLVDPGSVTVHGIGINNLPTSILVGKDGAVKAVHIGMFTEDSLEAEITPLLN
jgi:cytochrome c biogenesis protein CcmG, thiol:disulfide interchange protein DsbE